MTTTHHKAVAAGLALLLTGAASAVGAGSATAADGTVQLPVLASQLDADAACATGSDQRATDVPWEQVSSSSAAPGRSRRAPG